MSVTTRSPVRDCDQELIRRFQIPLGVHFDAQTAFDRIVTNSRYWTRPRSGESSRAPWSGFPSWHRTALTRNRGERLNSTSADERVFGITRSTLPRSVNARQRRKEAS